MKIAKSARKYVQNVVEALVTTAVGMRITMRYLLQKPITVQYPNERLPIPHRFRGVHYLEQEKCINCQACVKACPVNCIEMEAIKHGKEREWVKFTINYQKCLFCEMCVHPCQSHCLHMGPEYALVVEDKEDLIVDLLSFRGMSREAIVRKKEAEKKKAEKEAAKAKAAAAKKAKEAKAAAEGEGDEKPAKPAKPAKKKPSSEEGEPKDGEEA